MRACWDLVIQVAELKLVIPVVTSLLRSVVATFSIALCETSFGIISSTPLCEWCLTAVQKKFRCRTLETCTPRTTETKTTLCVVRFIRHTTALCSIRSASPLWTRAGRPSTTQSKNRATTRAIGMSAIQCASHVSRHAIAQSATRFASHAIKPLTVTSATQHTAQSRKRVTVMRVTRS